MIIKTYSDFINEELTANDKNKIKQLLVGMMHNINTHGFVPEFAEVNQEDKTVYINVSAKEDALLNECTENITAMILPSNFTPNALLSLETGSYSKETTLDKFEVIKDPGTCEMCRNLYDDVKKEYGDINMVIVSLMY